RRAREEGSPLALQIAGGRDAAHGGHIDEAARRGDAWAIGVWTEVAPLLAVALANAVTLLNPARLILGGSVAWGTPDLMARMRAHFPDRVNIPSGKACSIVDAQLGDAAGILGSAALAAFGS